MGDISFEQFKEDLAQGTFARQARLILSIRDDEAWRGWGYKSFQDWATRFSSENPGFLKRTQVYEYRRVAERLGFLGNNELERIGVGNCVELARLVAPGDRPSREWVQRAMTMPSADFGRAVALQIRKSGGPVLLGAHLDPSFRGLQYAPSNEQGVVFLFGMIAEELGFRVECVRREYPDCIAKQRVSERPEHWVERKIEFEFRSSNFSHPPEGSHLIVCWEDDLKGDAPLPVLELRTEIEKLPRKSPRPGWVRKADEV